ncbi:DUF6146 family protein [Flavobacterium weaverense]|uniref:Uncharacterized protein n=1 Tax=Flavobacterium weaverense TaxID=271156 RepID=A0A3M0A0S9_9FLAO|nr:DUF6146 family protein [Flavobacterium weaverense]RMA76235.1 hypothetical protein BC961_1962 [Flavobacterium weaverense]
MLVVIFGILLSCNSSKQAMNNTDQIGVVKSDTIRIANEELEYEVLIIDSGFSSWLITNSYPRNYHSQSYLEAKNNVWVAEYNNRALQPSRYSSYLYEMPINYNANIDYGYEVNYLIYNYMVYFQNTNKQKLFGYVPQR